VAASYAVFSRYLFEYRAGLRLPTLLLVDAQSRANRIYFSIPSAEILRADLQRLAEPDRERLALPFAGRYYTKPHRSYYKMGAAFYWAGYPDQAIPYLRETVQRDPGNWKCVNAIGQIDFDGGRFDAAKESFERVLTMHPGYPPALLSLGQIYAKREDLGRAEELFGQVIAADSRNSDAANQLGLVYARQGRTELAKKSFLSAITAHRDHSPAINNLGVLYMNQSQPQEAIAAFEYGLQAAPDDEQLYLNLSRVYISLGNRDKARDVMQRLLAHSPGNAVATKALRELDARQP